MPFAAADDTDLHYEVRGRGAPLLLLMGLGGAGDLWGAEFLGYLARTFRLIVLDHRGTGLSGRGGGPYTIARLAEDAACVLDAEGLLAAHVLGVSMGGMVAMELAATHPARVHGLVLGCTTPGGSNAVPPRRSALEDLRRLGLLGISALLVTSEFQARRTGLLTRLAVKAMARPPAPGVLAEQVAAALAFDISDRLHQIVAPTLVITGDRDQLVPPQNARLLVRAIRGARGVIVRDTAHCFFWEAPERAARAITEFLTSVAVAPQGY